MPRLDPRRGRPDPHRPPWWFGPILAAGAVASLAVVGIVVGIVVALAVAAIDWLGRH